MTTNNSSFSRRTPVIAVGLLFVAGTALPNASAQAVAPLPSTLSPVNQAIVQLKATRTLLHKADHDYQGYRVKGIHQITQAIHALEGTKPPKQLPPAGPGQKGGGNEPQAVSDAQLAEAIQQLQVVQTQLTTIPGRHVTVAREHIGKSIQDLQTALKIK
jgi:hypothetical protein